MVNEQIGQALLQRIAPVARLIRQAEDELLQALGITSSAGWCLVRLGRMGVDGRQSDLAHALDITQPSLVRTLDQLEAAGLIARMPHPKDKRSNRIALTPTGAVMASRIEEQMAGLYEELLKGLPETAAEITANVLDLIGQRLAGRRATRFT